MLTYSIQPWLAEPPSWQLESTLVL
jgi:hypothetical protein